MFIVRSPSGVTRMRQRPVGVSLLASPSLKTTPMERMSCANTLANWSWPTLPMKPTLPPSEAMPAQVFAAEPPDVSTAGPIRS